VVGGVDLRHRQSEQLGRSVSTFSPGDVATDDGPDDVGPVGPTGEARATAGRSGAEDDQRVVSREPLVDLGPGEADGHDGNDDKVASCVRSGWRAALPLPPQLDCQVQVGGHLLLAPQGGAHCEEVPRRADVVDAQDGRPGVDAFADGGERAGLAPAG
jgi:hypothetical protein